MCVMHITQPERIRASRIVSVIQNRKFTANGQRRSRHYADDADVHQDSTSSLRPGVYSFPQSYQTIITLPSASGRARTRSLYHTHQPKSPHLHAIHVRSHARGAHTKKRITRVCVCTFTACARNYATHWPRSKNETQIARIKLCTAAFLPGATTTHMHEINIIQMHTNKHVHGLCVPAPQIFDH